ncbi:MAG: hypothetical protein RDU14_16875 [Melioribacteraceae bacterium]|nr:hypothetical protein [Melioribacteraceae bacterium]
MLKLIKFKKHLDNGYGKPVCDYNASGKTVKWGEGLYTCEKCHAKVKAAQQKQDQIDLLNSNQQDIQKQLYVNGSTKPRNLEPEVEQELRSQLITIERNRRAIISTVNTVESDIMAQLTAHRYYSQGHGVAI